MSTYSGGSRNSGGGGRYSDDFTDDDDDGGSTPRRHNGNYNKFRGRGRGAPLRGRGRGQRGQGRGNLRGRGHSRNSEPADMGMRNRGFDTVTTRVMSASRNKINELRNRVEEMKLKLRDLEQENKLYKKLQLRQERAIRSFEDKENDLPNILDKHNNEIRSLKEQNRRLREKYDKTDRYLRDAEDELERVKKKMVKYKKLCDENELPEREDLARKVTKAELDMEEKDVKIKELERHIESLKKNHRHELGIEAARQRELKKQLEEATDKATALADTVKVKEKALDYANIYSNPNRNRSSTRDNSPNDSPSRGRKGAKSKASSMSDITPRDKAKFYAEKKRAELLKQKEIKADQEKKKRQKWEEEEKERLAREKEEREAREEREQQEKEREQKERDEIAARYPSPPQFHFRSIDRSQEEKEEQDRRKREEEQKARRERENREAKEELERKRLELENRRDQEQKRERDERDRREREERERREREDRERKEREERDRREKEREEQERRAQAERERLDNDPALLEERRKKDELLRKLQEMDQLGSAGKTESEGRDSSSPSRYGGGDGFNSGKRRASKEYSFSKPIDNLHRGKPAHEDVSVPHRQRPQPTRKPMTLLSGSNQDDNAGYQPSFGPPGAVRGGAKGAAKPLSIFDNDNDNDVGAFTVTNSSTVNNSKKSGNLLENLFGPQAATSNANITNNSSTKRADDNKTFFVTSQASMSPVLDKAPAHQKGNPSNGSIFPWDSNTTKTASKPASGSLFNTDNSSTLFGGGAALIDDDYSPNSNKVLPRRRQQANLNTFSSKPSVIAMDNFDDEIEEVVL